MKNKFLLSFILATLFLFAGCNVAYAQNVQSGTLPTYTSAAVLQDQVIVLGYSQSKNVYEFKSAVILANVDVNTPAAGAFTCVAATDVCTDAAHGFTTGLKGQGTTTTTLPGGLSTSTDYFVIYLSADTYSLATSYANAIAGTAINITDTGTGTHTFTPTAIAGATISLQGSIDGTTFADIASSSSAVTVDATFIWNISDPYYPFVRVKYVNTAGTFTSVTKWSGKR